MDGLEKILLGLPLQAYLVQIEHLPVVQDPDDDALKFPLNLPPHDRQDRNPEAEQAAVYPALYRAVLTPFPLEPVHTDRAILEHRQDRLRLRALLRTPQMQLAVLPEVKLGPVALLRDDMDIAGLPVHRLDQARLH